MKRFILFLFVLFFAFSSNIKAQTQVINSLVISQAIQCPGGQGSLTVTISDTAAVPTMCDVVLQNETNQVGVYMYHSAFTNTTGASFTFPNLTTGNYRVLLTHPSLNSSTYPTASSY